MTGTARNILARPKASFPSPRDAVTYILDTFPVLKKKEEKAFGEFISKRKCLEEYDRIKPIMNAG